MPNTTRQKFDGREKLTPNKSTAEIRALAQEYGPEAIRKVLDLMWQSHDPKVLLAATKEILDRGYGRPAEMVRPRPPDDPPKIEVVWDGEPPPSVIGRHPKLKINSAVETDNSIRPTGSCNSQETESSPRR